MITQIRIHDLDYLRNSNDIANRTVYYKFLHEACMRRTRIEEHKFAVVIEYPSGHEDIWLAKNFDDVIKTLDVIKQYVIEVR